MPTPSAAVLSKKSHIVRRLSKVLPVEAVISEEHETRAYECDALTASPSVISNEINGSPFLAMIAVLILCLTSLKTFIRPFEWYSCFN